MNERPNSQQESVAVEFTLNLGDSQISATAVVPAGHTNLTRILPVLQAFDDSFIADVASKSAEDGRTVSCKAGCGACCRQMVPISIYEAEALSAWIRTLPESRQQELAQRFHQALLKLAAAGLLDRMANEDWLAETETTRQLTLDYLYQRVPCPFLEAESCSIYPIRPLVCREYLVTSAPEYCVDLANPQVAPIRLPVYFSRVLHAIGAALEHDKRGWIPLVFLFAWMKSGAHPGEAFSGTGSEVLHRFVECLREAQIPSHHAESPAENPPSANR